MAQVNINKVNREHSVAWHGQKEIIHMNISGVLFRSYCWLPVRTAKFKIAYCLKVQQLVCNISKCLQMYETICKFPELWLNMAEIKVGVNFHI